MRKALLATLALSPVLLHAQANSPAQPQASSVLESRLASPNAIGSANRGTTTPIRISTGVIAPKLIHVVDISSSGEDWAWRVGGINRTAVVSMVVDEKGVPSNLKIVRSAGADIDSNVIAAVRQYRFQPGTLNHEPTAVPVNLEITIQNAVR
jgi:TonB family protein